MQRRSETSSGSSLPQEPRRPAQGRPILKASSAQGDPALARRFCRPNHALREHIVAANAQHPRLDAASEEKRCRPATWQPKKPGAGRWLV
jgi:hypothetical protein